MIFNENVSLETALDVQQLKEMGYKWALIYNYDQVQLGSLEEIVLEKDNLIEARIFNEEKEIHLFKQGMLKAVEFIEQAEDEFISLDYLIIPKKFNNPFLEKIGIKNYLAYDCSSQVYITYTRPYRIEY